jgi:hypothetical protein
MFVASASQATTYYFRGFGNIANKNSWGANLNGGGAHPANFTASNQVFVIRTNTTISKDLTISGSGSKLVIGDISTAGITVTIPTSTTVSANVEVAGAASGTNTLIVTSPAVPNITSAVAGSNVVVNGTGSQNIAGGVYQNLTLNSGNKVANGSITINGSLTITSGKLCMSANQSLTLNGNFVGSRTNCIQLNQGVSNLNGGATDIVINGSGAMDSLFFDQTGVSNCAGTLTVNRTGGSVKLGNDLRIRDELKMNSGNLHTAGMLTLTSDSRSQGTASIGEVKPGCQIVGDITVERFIPGQRNNSRAWRFLCSPVNGPSFASSWQKDIHITGPGTGGSLCPSLAPNANGFDPTPANSYSSFRYNEVTGAWVPVANTNTTQLAAGAGYRVFIRGNRNQGCVLLTGSSSPVDDVVLKATGTVVTGDFPVQLTYTPAAGNGWHLVGNPYAAPLDWNHATWVSERGQTIANTVYVFNPTAGSKGSYAAWNPVGGAVNGGSNIIQSGQSFFVKTAAATTLTFREAYKSTDHLTEMFGKAQAAGNLRIRLSDSLSSDEAVVFGYPGAQKGTDDLDGEKMGYTAGSIATLSAVNSLLTFNAMPVFRRGSLDTVQIRVWMEANKKYDLDFEGAREFPSHITVLLFDRFAHTLTDLKATSRYSFNSGHSSYSLDQSRFTLIFADPAQLPVSLLQFYADEYDHSVNVTWTTATETNASYFEVERSSDASTYETLGKVDATGNSVTMHTYSFTDRTPLNGTIAYYRLKQVDHDGGFTYSAVAIVKSNESAAGIINVYPNPASGDAIAISTGVKGAITITLTDIAGRVWEKSETITTDGKLVHDISSLLPGIYIFSVQGERGQAAQVKLIRN